jgi:hypothetical protein
METFITTQYSPDVSAADTDGSNARKVLQRLVVLRVRNIEDVHRWQGAAGRL